jgi:hypothetical protein
MTDLPSLPQRAGTILLRDLIDLYMAHYAGRDTTRVQRLGWWQCRLGHIQLQAVSDDDVHASQGPFRRCPQATRKGQREG